MSKRSRVSRSDSFDQPNFPNKSSSTNNPNKFFKPSSDLSNNANVATEMTIDMDDFPKECFYCKSDFKKEHNIHIYRSLAFCKEECRDVQIAFDENVMKTRLKASNKKVDN